MASMLAFVVFLVAAVYGAPAPTLHPVAVFGNASVPTNKTYQLAPRQLMLLGKPSVATNEAHQLAVRPLLVFDKPSVPTNETHQLAPRQLLGPSIRLFRLAAQYAAAAYCPLEKHAERQYVHCAAGNCPVVEDAGATLFFAPDLPRVSDDALIAIDEKHERVVLAIRGSVGGPKMREPNDKYMQFPSDLCADCGFTSDVVDTWLAIENAVLESLKRALHEHNDFRLIITGHSNGGGVASVAAARIRRANNGEFADITDLYTFGVPFFGNDKVVEWINEVGGPNYFITNALDRNTWDPHSNVEPVYRIARNFDSPTPADINTFAKGEEMTSRTWFSEAHNHYFGHITGCVAN
ncbi:MAG: hypothetical protein Q9167_001402 [Letrouitia subvulpina]